MIKFDREKHVYQSQEFEELIKDTIRFFNGTPVHTLPPPEKFYGTGVYAIYYIGKFPQYKKIYEQNRMSFNHPVYIGKAVPTGWRQARSIHAIGEKTFELHTRLKEHSTSISHASNIENKDFRCRFMILENDASSMIGTVEAALIRFYTPLWNSSIDGFGNHDPGKGRYNQAKSDWDVLHPGRPWAEKCQGVHSTGVSVKENIATYFTKFKE
ncbi:Eco29kI family restriction endonuclease [Desulforhopalus vacuolatus]|uniref:Eco29kI family restriction endonuclease n=1 Tax=Desulforhopalus vacuolatus TaxID=40414 RepID=UPI0019637B2E|nr:Eco29kI family restriction endonuclease [Desulforhopalus vacuolatus]MBM9520601.1 Eco29kI family restriction endonuclease [Desulforhopalus vacuolatus]